MGIRGSFIEIKKGRGGLVWKLLVLSANTIPISELEKKDKYGRS
jgi:hypothetical protein